MKFDVVIAGVGGQGTVLASRLLGDAAIKSGYFVRTAETIGMAQRGGCVTSHVRINSEHVGPVIPNRTADLLLGFEMGEVVRNLNRLSPMGQCIVNKYWINPVPVSLGLARYNHEDLEAFIRENVPNVQYVDAYSLAVEAGTAKAVNVVMLGAVFGLNLLPICAEFMEETILKNVKEGYRDLNRKAFRLGMNAVRC
ncbi:MAG: indolepyruvate oxidoreductase subunit beta [Clostridiaceae bacterium]|nr:indolepyruvate oxidoreductase subunit beta [Clostridiaceae bacterium]